ncbi:MAG: hypothetical protein M1587_07240 [Thaumarchaeota archaeon]|nr:hypothetical protein [Nitrososphaerota archaeon]
MRRPNSYGLTEEGQREDRGSMVQVIQSVSGLREIGIYKIFRAWREIAFGLIGFRRRVEGHTAGLGHRRWCPFRLSA